ncbi:hypothetical protein ASZ90_016800 [hydrocarbon metagenome]|uniref:Uncharacterized protein n=1 Tax=hydrocarbon metagenome TaxID=938273 RepID=A0A0W8EB91_9ZZZZ
MTPPTPYWAGVIHHDREVKVREIGVHAVAGQGRDLPVLPEMNGLSHHHPEHTR